LLILSFFSFSPPRARGLVSTRLLFSLSMRPGRFSGFFFFPFLVFGFFFPFFSVLPLQTLGSNCPLSGPLTRTGSDRFLSPQFGGESPVFFFFFLFFFFSRSGWASFHSVDLILTRPSFFAGFSDLFRARPELSFSLPLKGFPSNEPLYFACRQRVVFFLQVRPLVSILRAS